MGNLGSIVVLLQVVLSLLSNPQTANNAQTKALASQAVSMAAQALSQSIQSTSPAMGSPDFESIPVASTTPSAPQVSVSDTNQNPPTCKITASVQNVINLWANPQSQPLTTFEWTLTGMDPNTEGKLIPPTQNLGGQPNLSSQTKSIWGYFPGEVRVQFGGVTCSLFFPDIPWTPSSTMIVSQ